MSYYQLISLKLQLGIDPDTTMDHATLLKMWKDGRKNPAAATKTPATGRARPISRPANVHYMHSA